MAHPDAELERVMDLVKAWEMDRLAQAGRTIDYRKVAFAQMETLHGNPHLRRSRKMANTSPQTGYAPVNGLEMYYEIHGTGRPLLVLF